MNHPINSVKHVTKRYQALQIIATIFVALTCFTALAAIISGFRVTKLNHQQQEIRVSAASADKLQKELSAELTELKKQLSDHQQQLTTEKKRSKSLSAKIRDLEKKLKKAKQSPPPAENQAPTPAVKPVEPEGIENPEAPKKPEVTNQQMVPDATPEDTNMDPASSTNAPEPATPTDDASTSGGTSPGSGTTPIGAISKASLQPSIPTATEAQVKIE